MHCLRQHAVCKIVQIAVLTYELIYNCCKKCDLMVLRSSDFQHHKSWDGQKANISGSSHVLICMWLCMKNYFDSYCQKVLKEVQSIFDSNLRVSVLDS